MTENGSGDGTENAGDDTMENRGRQFDRLPTSTDEREVEGRASRAEVLDWFEERFGIDPAVFDGYTFWEKGAGSVWILRGDAPSPIEIEALGMRVMHTRQEHWKPTTNAVQRFGPHATRNVIDLDADEAATFVAGDDQEIAWDGDWGYLIATGAIAGEREPLGVGLYTYGTLQSTVPKGRRVLVTPPTDSNPR